MFLLWKNTKPDHFNPVYTWFSAPWYILPPTSLISQKPVSYSAVLLEKKHSFIFFSPFSLGLFCLSHGQVMVTERTALLHTVIFHLTIGEVAETTLQRPYPVTQKRGCSHQMRDTSMKIVYPVHTSMGFHILSISCLLSVTNAWHNP